MMWRGGVRTTTSRERFKRHVAALTVGELTSLRAQLGSGWRAGG